MCGFGTVSNLPVVLSPEAQRQLTFSKKATELQGTSIRQHYNLQQPSPSRSPVNTTEPTSPIAVDEGTTPKTTLDPAQYHGETIKQMAQWLHRRGPDITQVVDISSIVSDSVSNPSQGHCPPQLSIISSVLHLRGRDDEPFPQPVVSTPFQPLSRTSYQLQPPADVFNPADATFDLRFNSQHSSTTLAINTTHFTTPPTVPTPDQALGSPSITPHNRDDSYYFCWNGEVFAGELEVPVGQSDTSLLFTSLQNAITTATTRHPDPTSPQSLAWESIGEYSTTVVNAVHDVMNMIQGPYAMFFVHQSAPVTTQSHPHSPQRITTIAFCRDKVGRRSLVLQLPPPPSSSNNTAASISLESQPQHHPGFILSSQPFLTDPSTYPPNRSCFTRQDASWCELPCSGLFSISYGSLQHPSSQPQSLNFTPWNRPLFLPSSSSPSLFSTTKIPETMLFPSLHPSLTPVPLPSTLPPQLQPLFARIAANHPNPLTAQIFFLRLAEAVRRQVQQLPLITQHHTTLHNHPFDFAQRSKKNNVASIYPLPQPSNDILEFARLQTQIGPAAATSAAVPTPTPTQHLSTETDQLWAHVLTTKARICVLFSGGIDCTVVAALAHFYLPEGEPIDLVNVAFAGTQSAESIDTSAPDRVAAQDSLIQLCNLAPQRLWRLIKVNVTKDELLEHTAVISSLVAPHDTTMDFNIGTVLYFGSRSLGFLHLPSQRDFDTYNNAMEGQHQKQAKGKGKQQNNNSNANSSSAPTTTRYAGPTTPLSPHSPQPLSQKERQQQRRQRDDDGDDNGAEVEVTRAVFEVYFPERSVETKFTQKLVNAALPRPLAIKMKKIIGEDSRLRTAVGRAETKLAELLANVDTPDNSQHENEVAQLQQDIAAAKQVHQDWRTQNETPLYVSKVLFENFPINPVDCPATNATLADSSQDAKTTNQNNNTIIYTSHARVLLLGSGADEQLAGYGRHRTAFKNALRHLMAQSLCQEDIDEIKQRELELYGTVATTSPNPAVSNQAPSSQTASNPPVATEPKEDDDDDIGAGWLELIQLYDCDVIASLHRFQEARTAGDPPTRIKNLSPRQHLYLQQCLLLIDLKKDTLRMWLRNLGRDDRVIAYWGKESRIAFLDEDVMHFLSHVALEAVSSNALDPTAEDSISTPDLSAYHSISQSVNTIYTNQLNGGDNSDGEEKVVGYIQAWEDTFAPHTRTDFRVPLTTICDLTLPLGIGDKQVLRVCAKAMGIVRVSSLQKRAMQFGSKIANRHCTGVVRLSQVTSVLDIVNPQLLGGDEPVTAKPRRK